MKQVYLKCVYKKNLGDDLLIKILCDRYKKTRFYVLNTRNGDITPKIDNLTEINPNMLVYRFYRKLSNIMNRYNIYELKQIKNKDMIVTVAGSIFMEDKEKNELSKTLKFFLEAKKPYYIIGSNIGPVYTEEYIKTITEKIIKPAKDICLRDKKSYNLVKSCKNVRYAPDVVFNLDCSEYSDIVEEKKVIISVINIDKKANQIVTPDKDKYKKAIHDIINYFIKKKYKVELFSFCKNEEGDEEAIEEILLENPNRNKILRYYYDGNIDDALKELATAQIIVGTRFHANVLGLLMNKTIIPIIYNDKTRELLSDIKFKGKYLDIEDIDSFNIKDFTDEDLKYKLKINKVQKEAQKHFEKLDKKLK